MWYAEERDSRSAAHGSSKSRRHTIDGPERSKTDCDEDAQRKHVAAVGTEYALPTTQKRAVKI